MEKLFLSIIITSILFTSCSKSDELTTGGTFKVTASNGITKTLNMNSSGIPSFRCEIEEKNSSNNKIISVSLYGMTDAGAVDLFFDLPNPIQIGKEYSFTYNLDNYVGSAGTGVELEDWIDSDGLGSGNVVLTTIKLSSFQYPGRMAGIVVNYNKKGNVLAKGEFDFVFENQAPTPTQLSKPSISTAELSAINTTTAVCGGNLVSDGGAAVTSHGVCWSTTHEPTISNSKTSDGTGMGSFASSIIGLSINTIYYVRAYATNSVGTAYGAELQFKTITIGMPYLGGKIAYIDNSRIHGFVCALTQKKSQWTSTGRSNHDTQEYYGKLQPSGVYGITNSIGKVNSLAILSAEGAGTYAASICAAMTDGGATAGDWYLPSIDELNQLYINRNILGDFSEDGYWSSTEFQPENGICDHAYFQSFSAGVINGINYSPYVTYGKMGGFPKNTYLQVRAIRAF